MTEDKKEKLVLIDGNAVLHRAYHALPPLTTRSGELVNAVYGFASMLLKILSDFQPKYLIVAFDTPKPTFRKQEFVGYQAKRPIMDKELSGQIEKVHELVRTFNIPIFAVEGYEADDVIGSLAEQAASKRQRQSKSDNLEVVIVTGDRDLMQLVSEKVKLFMPQKGLSEGQIFGEKEVEGKMGIPPKQIVDYKGLVGDSADNYPGVPGIGPKTAIELLKKFGSLEGIYRRLGDERRNEAGEGIGESVKGKLREGRESAILSKKLATIVTNVPISLDWEKCQTKEFDKERVAEFFKELGFRSLVGRVRGTEAGKAERGGSGGKRRERRGTKGKAETYENQIKLF